VPRQLECLRNANVINYLQNQVFKSGQTKRPPSRPTAVCERGAIDQMAKIGERSNRCTVDGKLTKNVSARPKTELCDALCDAVGRLEIRYSQIHFLALRKAAGRRRLIHSFVMTVVVGPKRNSSLFRESKIIT
jgi:hypothetical protein